MLKKLKLRQKLILLTAGLILIGVLFFAGASYLQSTQALRKQINQNMTAKFEDLYEKVESFLKAREAILLGEATFARNNLGNQKVLRHLTEQYDYLKSEYSIVDIYAGYPDGTQQSGSRRKIMDIDWKSYQRSWYIEAEKNPDKINYTEVYADVHTGSPVVTLSKFIQKGEEKAVMAIDISLLQLGRLLNGEKLGEMGYAFILYKDGRFLVHPQYSFSSRVEQADTIFNINQGEVKELGMNLLNNEMEMFRAAYQGREKMYLAKHIGHTDFYLVAGMDQQEFRRQMNLILVYNLFLAAIAVLGFGLIVYVTVFFRKDTGLGGKER